MKWLKLWDGVVFHKDNKRRPVAAQKQKNKENEKKVNKKKSFKASLDDDTDWNVSIQVFVCSIFVLV